MLAITVYQRSTNALNGFGDGIVRATRSVQLPPKLERVLIT